MRVALLTSQLGNGHTGALQAIEEKLLDGNTSCRTRRIDFWGLMDSTVAKAVKEAYLDLVIHYPAYYDYIYRFDQEALKKLISEDTLPPELTLALKQLRETWFPRASSLCSCFGAASNIDQALLSTLVLSHEQQLHSLRNKFSRNTLIWLIRAILVSRLKRELCKFKPDVIVATQIYPVVLMSFLKQQARFKNIPLIGVVTDYGLHKLWAQPCVDHYCLPDTFTANSLGVYRQSAVSGVHVSGIPIGVDYQFLPSQREARRRLGLSLNKPTLLITGGLYGIGIAEAVETLVQNRHLQIIVTLGRESSLPARLVQHLKQRKRNLKVFKWYRHMPVLYRAADIVIGKPGGMTVTESIACERPFIANYWLNGQELFNLHFIEREGVGTRCNNAQLPRLVDQWLNTPGQLERLKKRCRALRKPDAAAQVVNLIRHCVGSPFLSNAALERAITVDLSGGLAAPPVAGNGHRLESIAAAGLIERATAGGSSRVE